MEYDGVFLLGWDNSANAADWIIDIVFQVNVSMHGGLPRWNYKTNANIGSIWL